MAAMRGVTAISRLKFADPSRRRAPSIRPPQPPGRDKSTGIRAKRIAFFRNIIVYYRIYGKL
jgi:hypothetical protein